MIQPPDCDLFCRVIDNYGDAGVCLRLARQLHDEHGWRIRLWADDLDTCAQLMQGATPPGLEICHWTQRFPEVEPAATVIEAFACELPENYLAAMAAMPEKPVWLNLEYLCVEEWGPRFHLQPSPHPSLPLLKHFFVPGILPGTGGTLCETNLLSRQAAFDVDAARRRYSDDIAGRWVFLFCYDNPALPMLLDIWANGAQAIHCLVSAGKPSAQCSAWLGQTLTPGSSMRRGQLHLHALPFVDQKTFDTALWTCDLNFVRGEDSFCRALWAGLPLVWHIYPQQENAHHEKLAAFQAAYSAPQVLIDFNRQWNALERLNPTTLNAAWHLLDESLVQLESHAMQWRNQLADLGNLAENLTRFCSESKN